MNITVIGAGAIGGYFGGRLAESGSSVTFLVRKNRAAQLEAKGLNIKSTFGDVSIEKPQIALDVRDITSCDLVLLSVKNYQLEDTLPQLKVLVDQGAKILPLLNGVEHYEILKKEFGKENVLGGLCRIISTLDSEGTILHTSKIHHLVFGALEPSSVEFCNELEQVMSRANFVANLKNNILYEIWSKYAYIAAFSGVSTAGDITTDQIHGIEAAREVFARTLEEMKMLAGAYGVALPDNFVTQNVEGIGKFSKGTTSSMHQDRRKGLPLEVESFHGAAIRMANSKGLELPTVYTLYGLIKPHELGV